MCREQVKRLAEFAETLDEIVGKVWQNPANDERIARSATEGAWQLKNQPLIGRTFQWSWLIGSRGLSQRSRQP
jgi:hypothetical protein